MSDQSLGHWLRRERERRGITLRAISDETKVALPFFQGLEADDLARWPTGIFRRSFVRAYATAVGLDPEDILHRFELEHGTPEPVQPSPSEQGTDHGAAATHSSPVPSATPRRVAALTADRARLLGTAADLTVALVVGLGSAAAGSRLLWPVLLIAAYYAIGVLLTGTSPMVALLQDVAPPGPAPVLTPAAEPRTVSAERRVAAARRPLRVVRPTSRAARSRAQ